MMPRWTRPSRSPHQIGARLNRSEYMRQMYPRRSSGTATQTAPTTPPTRPGGAWSPRSPGPTARWTCPCCPPVTTGSGCAHPRGATSATGSSSPSRPRCRGSSPRTSWVTGTTRERSCAIPGTSQRERRHQGGECQPRLIRRWAAGGHQHLERPLRLAPLRVGASGINSRVFRNLTVTSAYSGPFNLRDIAGGGTMARVM